MGDVWITDMTQFEGIPAGLSYEPAGRIAEFFGAIVSVGSVCPADVLVHAALFCRRRPGRRPCPGHLKVQRDSVSGIIAWHCSHCDDQGEISNWESTPWNRKQWLLDRPANRKLLKLVLTKDEIREVRQNPVLSSEAESLLYGAIIVNGDIVVRATLEELDDFQGCVAFDANHEEKKRRQKVLDKILGKIEAIL